MRSRSLAISAAALTLLLALYALAGFVLLPGLIKDKAPGLLQHTGHRLSIDEIRFNPFTLDIAAAGISLQDASGKPLLRVPTLEADVEWRSLLQRAPVLSALQIGKPELHVEIDEQGRVNLAALSRDDGQPSAALPRFYIGSLNVSEGVVAFADLREPYANRFEQLSLKLSALSTLDDKGSAYALTARTPDGTRLQWQGELSLQPIALSGRLDVSGIELPALAPYLDPILAAPPSSGTVALQMPHRFLIQDGRPQLLVENAAASLSGLALQADASAKPAATPSFRLDKLTIEGMSLDLLARKAGATLLRIEGAAASMQRNADGSLDILRLLRSASPAAAQPAEKTATGPAWSVSLARAELAGGTVSLVDSATGVSAALENLEGHAQGYAHDSRELAFELKGGMRGGGILGASGKLMLRDGRNFAGMTARVAATGLPVTLLQPLVTRSYRLRLASGEVALAGDVQVGGKESTLRYTGSLSVNNVDVKEAAAKAEQEGARLLAWKSFGTDRLTLTLGPDRLDIDELRLVAPVAQLVIAPDRTMTSAALFPPSNRRLRTRRRWQQHWRRARQMRSPPPSRHSPSTSGGCASATASSISATSR